MSRLIVKNLPSYVTPAKLKEHFEQKAGPGGTLTDFKVVHKQDGTSRRFGFVGYKTDEEALKAKEWFDRTFIDSTRISVNVIQGAKDAPAPRPNKRRRTDTVSDDEEGPSTSKPITKTKKAKPSTKLEKSQPDSQLDKFLEVMQPRTKLPTWANETSAQAEPVPEPGEGEPSGSTAVEQDDAAQDEAIDDMEWMRRRMTQNVDKVEKEFEQSDDEDGPAAVLQVEETPEEAEPEPPKDPTKETILQTARLFVRNLAFSCTEDELAEFFRPYGEVNQVHIPVDINTKQPKGVGYVTYRSPSSALAAYEALDKKSFQGRLLHILGAVDRRGQFQAEEGEGKKKTLKEEKQAKRKAVAGKEFNWGMLYMNSDAVASSIASRLNVDKSSILNPESGDTNAAVKLALAETHIIQETKTFLESQGINLSSFSTLPNSRTRSDTIVLVKNIPFGTSEAQIRELFDPHGIVKRVIVPPAGTIAVVEYEKADEARKGFRSVAYRRIGNSIIYLEMGPVGMFVEGASAGPSTSTLPLIGKVGGLKIREQEEEAAAAGDEATAAGGSAEAEPSILEGTTLYVKNLSFATTSERMTQMFRNLPSFSFARVQTKADPKNPANRLSMGYGFVGFKDVEGAKKALISLQGFNLDGHSLYVKFAGRGREEEKRELEKEKRSGGRTTKMIVKNVPFEATKKDIQALFGAHGHLKSVRLPKKFNSRTRGFAFLDFVSRAEAENAYETLRHTHLLGRHLVLEWAEEEEQDIEKLRAKAGVGYGEGKTVPWKKKKLEMRKDGGDDDPEPMHEP